MSNKINLDLYQPADCQALDIDEELNTESDDAIEIFDIVYIALLKDRSHVFIKETVHNYHWTLLNKGNLKLIIDRLNEFYNKMDSTGANTEGKLLIEE